MFWIYFPFKIRFTFPFILFINDTLGVAKISSQAAIFPFLIISSASSRLMLATDDFNIEGFCWLACSRSTSLHLILELISLQRACPFSECTLIVVHLRIYIPYSPKVTQRNIANSIITFKFAVCT